MTIQRILGESNLFEHQTQDELMIDRGFNNGDAYCQWFKGLDVMFEAFPILSLELVNE